MEYGINQEHQLIFCKNCGMIISKTGDKRSNFCLRCGAPLTVKGIELHEKQIVVNYQELKKEMLEIKKAFGFVAIKVELKENILQGLALQGTKEGLARMQDKKTSKQWKNRVV